MVAAGGLDLAATLGSGQVFRWRRDAEGSWVGVVGRSTWTVRLEESRLAVVATGGTPTAEEVARFFRFDVDLEVLAAAWRGTQPALDDALDRFGGLRVVRQPAHDALLGFAIASANQVGRIARSLDRLAEGWGTPINTASFALPGWETLAEADPLALWQGADLGYRGKVLVRLAAVMAARPAGWLDGLADLPYDEAQAELVALPGIGPKIADCVCLYGLGFDEAIPVDSHVWAIAHELFEAAIPTASLTARTYRAVGDLYRAAFPIAPGWAQHYLFHRRRLTPPGERRRAA
ncbi:MAG: DNA glycosylase [Dehalococcoidia bacterium]